MITLMLKGVLTISAAYLLASTTPIEKICAALRHLHFPKMIVTVTSDIQIHVRFLCLKLPG